MEHDRPPCPLCGRTDAVGNAWVHPNGRGYRTCHGRNRDEHLGVPHHFDAETMEPLAVRDRHHAPFLNLLSQRKPAPLRGFDADFLFKKCCVGVIPSLALDECLNDKPELWRWARSQEDEGKVISAIPFTSGMNIVGVQFRSFPRRSLDGPIERDSLRMHGEADALYVACYTGVNPSAVVVHEGPWGAIAATHDANEYGNLDIFSVATLSASTKPETIRMTLDLLFPGVPRFSLFDQDPAGVHARAKAQRVLKPISIMGAGSGKDYRDLDPAFRFEGLCEAVRRELKLQEEKPTPLSLSEPELDACLCKLPQTEFGLASRFIERHGKRCRYIDAWNRWAMFDGTRWSYTGCGAEAIAQDTITRLEFEAHHLKDQQ